MSYSLGKASLKKLEEVHPHLQAVVRLAIKKTEVDFKVMEGLRTKARQFELVAKGASKTMNSRHLTGHAVDLVAMEGRSVSWRWPLYHKVAEAMKAAAKELNVPIEWGGSWVSFPDGPHFQLPREEYP